MPKLKELLPGMLVIVLLSISVIGCVQFGETPDGYESDDDCMFCHMRSNERSAKDFSKMYLTEGDHHPVDVLYPPAHQSDDFNLPNGRHGNLAFFDSNGNGKPDHDEIRLYADKGGDEITCSSCHREHSKSPVHLEHPDDDYLRGTNIDGELCIVCHRKQQKSILHH